MTGMCLLISSSSPGTNLINIILAASYLGLSHYTSKRSPFMIICSLQLDYLKNYFLEACKSDSINYGSTCYHAVQPLEVL
jgi:hypothetical protein